MQDLDQALTCCVKGVQRTSYEQELEELLNHQEVSAKSSLKALHPFIDDHGILRVGGRLPTIRSTLSHYSSTDSATQASFHQIDCGIRTHTTASRKTTTADSITSGEILDPKNQKCGEISQSSMPDLLQV
jgi:hypothetical protein